jgi:lipopolysaccharide export system permease protein
VLKPLVKKLDLLIVKAFIGPFVATFFITLFVLVLQFFWLYIDDVVGKGIDMFTVARLIMYVSATLVPLALPLAVLLSSIMTFGNLGETFELIAIKSAGISLLRFMRPLFLVTLVISVVAFFFNNNVLPVANLKMNTLKYDIIVSKPAFDIKEGVFYDKIEGYVIKIGKKEKDDSTIRNVVIYEQNNKGLQDNIIVAEKGKMIVTPDKKALEFILQDGTSYQEEGERSTTNTQFTRMGFKEYRKVLDLSSFKMNKTDDSAFRNNYQMLTMKQLSHNIDSLEKVNNNFRKKAAGEIRLNLKFTPLLDTTGWVVLEKTPAPPSAFLRPLATVQDSLTSAWKAAIKRQDSLKGVGAAPSKVASKVVAPGAVASKVTSPTSSPAPPSKGPGSASPGSKSGVPASVVTGVPLSKTPPEVSFADLLPDSVRTAVLERSISAVNNTKISLDQPTLLFDTDENNLREHEIAWHEKLTLAVACLVMFLIGAPLGSIIRKGGIGMPLVIAVIFFVIFFLLNNFGKKFVKQDVLTPIGGMWMATYVLGPIGLFLVYKALHDSQLFNKEFYFRIIRRIRAMIQKKQSPPAAL